MFMKKFKIIICLFCSLFLISCSKENSKIENFYGKKYSAVGSSLCIMKKSKSYSCLQFNFLNSVKFKDKDKVNLQGGFFDYPKIVKKGNKNFLTAKDFPDDRFEIVSKDLIVDRYTGIELSSYEKSDEKIESLYGNIYEGAKGGRFSIVKKTNDYSLMAFHLPDDKNIKFKENVLGKKISASYYDNPKLVTIEGKNFLMADNFEEKRFEVFEDRIVDNFTGYEFGIKKVSKK